MVLFCQLLISLGGSVPILSIKALPQKEPSKVTIALKKTTMAIAEVYGCEPQHVWATWQDLVPGYYVEGSTEATSQPNDTHPPICELLCFEGKSPNEVESLLSVAAKTLSSELGIPNNIFITYREAKSGYVVAGNGIVRKND